ncbi:MAG: DUF4384 domain-containing protein, partial [Nitrospinales bacterium]
MTIILLSLALALGCARGVKTAHQKDETAVSKAGRPAVPREPPGWALGRGHSSFPSKRYLLGVGVSDDNAVSANESARSELAKSLKVKIRSVMRDVSTERGGHFELVVDTQVDAILEGVAIRDGWYDSDKKVYYSLAVLERGLAAAMVQDRIGAIESGLPQALRRGEEAERRGKVLNALGYYFSGYERALLLPPLKSAYRVITGSARPAANSGGLSSGSFVSRVNRITHNLKLSVVSGDRQAVKTFDGLRKPLAARVYLGETPVGGIPVAFRFERGSGELERNKISGSDGKVETRVHKILSFEEKVHQVSARLDYEKIASRFKPGLAEKFLGPLRGAKAVFDYSIDIPQWPEQKTLAWKKGITDLVNQVIRNLPPGGRPKVGILKFEDLRFNRSAPFGRILKEDFKILLVQADNLIVKEAVAGEGQRKPDKTLAKENGLDFYVTGSYRMEREGLEIRAQLTETETGHILSSAQTQIAKRDINPADLLALRNPVPQAATVFPGVPGSEGYDASLDKLLFSKPRQSSFKVSVWMDKSEYQIGETITFNVTADKDCYLTLLDIGSSGNVTVIFPNAFHPDNLIRAGVTVQIPGPGDRFKFDVQGPPGLERIKAAATLTPGTPIDLDLGQGFHSIKRGTQRGMRDIKAIAERFSLDKSSAWAEAYTEIFIYEKNRTYLRGSRKIPLIPKPKKPIDMIGTFGREQAPPAPTP